MTYLFTRGVHQYLTNNVTAPEFDPSTYTVVGPLPAEYNYQFQSGGIYKQNQVIVDGQYSIPSSVVAWFLHLQRSQRVIPRASPTFPRWRKIPASITAVASFGIRNRLFLLGTYSAPHGIIFAPLLAAQSGTPYNLVIGNDLTANNQFNARPTYGACGAADVVSTPYGCLDTDPVGKGERIIPYGAGIGPANFVMHMRVSKVIGIGPRIEGAKGAAGMQGGNGSVNGRGLSGAQAQPKLDATVSRKYSLTLIGGALNIFNIVNLGTPNGTLQFAALRQNAIPGRRSLRIADRRQPRCSLFRLFSRFRCELLKRVPVI